MTKRFEIGDHVTWNSEAGHVAALSSKCIQRTLTTRGTLITRARMSLSMKIESSETGSHCDA